MQGLRLTSGGLTRTEVAAITWCFFGIMASSHSNKGICAGVLDPSPPFFWLVTCLRFMRIEQAPLGCCAFVVSALSDKVLISSQWVGECIYLLHFFYISSTSLQHFFYISFTAYINFPFAIYNKSSLPIRMSPLCKLTMTEVSRVVSRNKNELHYILCADMMSNIPSVSGETLVRLTAKGRQTLERALVQGLIRAPSTKRSTKAQEERVKFAQIVDLKLTQVLKQATWSESDYTRLPTPKNSALIPLYDRPSPLMDETEHRPVHTIGAKSTPLRFIWQGNRDAGWSMVIRPTIWFCNGVHKKLLADSNTNLCNANGETRSVSLSNSACKNQSEAV